MKSLKYLIYILQTFGLYSYKSDLFNYLKISILCLVFGFQTTFAQTPNALEKAKIEVKKLQERLKNANEEVDFYQKKSDSLKQKTLEINEYAQELEVENQDKQILIDSLTMLNRALKTSNQRLEQEIKEKNNTIRKLQKTLEPIIENHVRLNSFLKADSVNLTLKACYLLIPDKNPPQRINVKVECWDFEGKQILLNQEFKIKLDQLPTEFDDLVGQQTQNGEENEESYCFYYNGQQKIAHFLTKGKYQYRLYVNNQFIKKEGFSIQ